MTAEKKRLVPLSLEIVRKLLDYVKLSADLQPISETEIDPLRSLLNIKEEGINSDLLGFITAAAAAAAPIIESEIRTRQAKILIKYSPYFFVTLHHTGRLNILNALVRFNDRDFWDVYPPISSALKYIEIDPQQLNSVLPILFEKIKNDHFGNKIFEGLLEFATYQPKEAYNVITTLLSKPNPISLLAIPYMVKGAAEVEKSHDLFKFLKPYTRSEDIEVKRIALVSVSQLKFDNDNATLDEVTQILDSSITGDKKLLARIAEAYSNLPVTEHSNQQLLRIALTEDPDALYIIARTVWLQKKQRGPNWLVKALEGLTKVPGVHTGTIGIICYILTETIDEDPKIFTNYINAWLSQNEQNYKHIWLFESFFVTLYQQRRREFQLLITDWLNSDDLVYQIATQTILHEFHPRDRDVELSAERINELSAEDIRFIIFKIMGFIYTPRYLQTLLYSILKVKATDNDISKLVIAAFNEYVIYNYGSTLTFLDEQINCASSSEKKVIKQIKSYWKEYNSKLRNLPVLNELKASDKRLMNYYKIQKAKYSNDIKETQKKAAPWMEMATTIQLKSKGWFSKQNGEYSNREDLKEFKVEGEMPRGEFIDPVGQAKRRYLWKIQSRRK